jgi:branched-chain amino acid transport system ATP-binding protein
MLTVRDLSVYYGPVRGVERADLDLPDGGAVCLLGPNGAGKSSTLRAISGLVSYRGRVEFDGQPLDKLTPDAIARRGLIHVPEGRRVFPGLSVHENLQVGMSANTSGRRGHSLDDVYQLFPTLARLRGRGGWALSGGEQQMVAIGRGLMGGPRLLVLDEPSLGLSPMVTREVFDALRGIARDLTILIVEQNTAQALGLCGYAYVMSGGRIVMSGTAAEMGERENLLKSFLGRKE